ncbi:MAG TPA: hypothetical protein VJH92_05485 [Candidatus Nanoarchaeia archaeon]|nr:hypothetical protein [Candidatus Nanoarchaeia archaeon]
MSRRILLPKDLNRRLEGLSLINQESNGVLLYRRNEFECPVDAIFMTGIGNEGHVKAQPQRVRIVNEFFKRQPSYGFVKFHTHTPRTIERYGIYYADHFSEQDITGYDEQISADPAFMGMVITPKTKLLYGLDNPKIEVVQPPLGHNRRARIITSSLNKIASEMGIQLDLLSASR